MGLFLVSLCRHNDAEFKKLEDHLFVCSQDADVMIQHSSFGQLHPPALQLLSRAVHSCLCPLLCVAFADAAPMDLGEDEDGKETSKPALTARTAYVVWLLVRAEATAKEKSEHKAFTADSKTGMYLQR